MNAYYPRLHDAEGACFTHNGKRGMRWNDQQCALFCVASFVREELGPYDSTERRGFAFSMIIIICPVELFLRIGVGLQCKQADLKGAAQYCDPFHIKLAWPRVE